MFLAALRRFIRQTQPVWPVVSGVAITILLANTFGILNLLEWAIRDEFFRRRSLADIEDRIVVVTIDESDIQLLGDWPITDQVLAQVLTNIRAEKPRVIGLDLYRDLPEEPGHQQLLEVFKATPELLGVEKIIGQPVAPPPVLAVLDQVAIVDVALDNDQDLRRILVSINDPDSSMSKTGLGIQVALGYLKKDGITLDPIDLDKQHFQLGAARFEPLARGAAGYSRLDLGGYQILMDWRGPSSQFQQISLGDVWAGNIPEGLMGDRVVYIGSVAASANDFLATPYSGGLNPQDAPMPGVFVHANVTSYFLDSALGIRPVLRGWTWEYQGLWIILWTLLGAVGNWSLETYNFQRNRRRRCFLTPVVMTSSGVALLLGVSYGSFLMGWMLPVMSPLVALVGSAIAATSRCKNQRLELTNQQLEFSNQQLIDHTLTLEKRVKERTQQLARAKKAADSANQAKSEFLANMSHELRTPLNGILGYAQILKNSQTLPDEDHNKISTIHQCATHLATLISDSLDLAKIEARKLELFPKEICLGPFLSSVAEICKIRALSKGLNVNLDFDPSLPQMVMMDDKRCRQVLINLISNGIKFTEQGSVTFRVKRLQPDPFTHSQDEPTTTPATSSTQICSIRISVEDTGIGMNRDQLQRVFEPFEQIVNHQHQVEGTGLGLAISQKIVTLMGSQLRVQSTPGKGSTFWMDLEIPVVHYGNNNHLIGLEQTDQKIIGIKDRKPSILVVDDSREDSLLLSDFLSSIGFKPYNADDGVTGLKLAQQQQPDLVITDLAMPNLNGLELIQQLRHTAKTEKIPIIVISANVFAVDRHQSVEAGADAFLPKPVDFKALLQLLQKLLHLQWLYATPVVQTLNSETPDINADSPSMISLATLDELYHLAMMGDVQGIENRLQEINVTDTISQGLVTRLQILAANFQIKQIQQLLLTHISLKKNS